MSATTKCQPFEVVFGQKAMPNERLLDHLFEQGFVNEEDIPQGLIDDFSYAPGDVSSTSVDINTAVGDESTVVMDWPTVDL
ncbi:MAG: hypothetical protein GY694_11170, partial [Gammaproteobacteria bacterium]|nr:hypothetical protein [Gammaproteobacteria bacterium]